MRKILIFVVILFLLSCNENPTNKKILVEFWTMQLKPTFTDYINNLINIYEKNNNNIKIKWIDVPSSEIEKKTLANIAGGTPPDLINLNPMFTSKMAELNALEPLDDLTSNFKDLYLPNIWKASIFDGKTFGIPWYLSTSVTIYNKDIFRQAGIDLSKVVINFKELKSIGRKIKEKTKKYLFMPSLGDKDKLLQIFVQDGIDLLDKNNKPVFYTQQAVETLTYWVSLYKENIIPRDSITEGHRASIDRFQTGSLAMLTTGPQFLRIIKENSPQLYKNLGVTYQLTGKSGKLNVGVMNLVIPKGSKHKDQAIKFAQFITNSENQVNFCKLVPILPSIQEALNNEYFQKISSTALIEDLARKISVSQLKQSTILIPPMKKSSELIDKFSSIVNRAFLENVSPEEVLKQASLEWEKILKN